jgi:regulator of nucleoside diphosphate kinase
MPVHAQDLRELDKPSVTIDRTSHERLLALGMAMLNRRPDIADPLLEEIDRAEVVPDSAMPADVVGMGSLVTFRDDNSGRVQRVRLVYPNEADIAAEKISVLTPIGTALIGLSRGQTMFWTARDGARRSLTVLEVGEPSRTDDPARSSSSPGS